jgi:GNAT superfamily N-acetyltransferase
MRGTDLARPVDVSIAPAAAADNRQFVADVVDLVNRVYADAEQGLWCAGAARTTASEVVTAVRAGELAVAWLDGRIVGVVRVQCLDSGEAEFGMLVASPEHRWVGIGTELVTFAERWARERGHDLLQLELLVPQTWKHPVKEFLRAWYTRIGYRPVRTGRFDEAYPALQPHLATACDFVIYHKTLGPAGSR